MNYKVSSRGPGAGLAVSYQNTQDIPYVPNLGPGIDPGIRALVIDEIYRAKILHFISVNLSEKIWIYKEKPKKE
jgi:hypothetical protein